MWEAISDGEAYIHVGNVEFPSRAYVAAFGFKGADQQKPAGVMSGGERNRMNLALTLKQGGNLLLLDEPTNDLDVENALGSLENALLEFPRLRGHHQPRPLVPGPGRHAHPGLGGRRELVLVRGQLRRLREEQDRAPRRRGRPPAPRHLPQADPRLRRVMGSIHVCAEGKVEAPAAATVYGYLADMREHHPHFLPPAFSGFQVESGGVGAGIVTHFTVTAGGRSREYRMRVSEPEPGRVLVESDTNCKLSVTTYTVTPDGGASRVRISLPPGTAHPGSAGSSNAASRPEPCRAFTPTRWSA